MSFQRCKEKDSFREQKFYFYKFFSDCLPIYALYTILFREKGLTVAEIALLLSFWSLIVMLLELPSGILADRWNRRNMLCLASLLKAACYILWCFSDTVLLFGLGFLFWGVSGAVTSGTEEGLIYDNLKNENRENVFSEIYGKGRFYATLGIMFAIVSSGILASFLSISAISLLSAGLCLINLYFISQLKEINFYSERLKEERIGYFDTFFEAVKLCANKTSVLISMIFLVTIVSITDYLDEYDALIIDDFKLAYIWISLILAVRFLFIAVGNRIAPKIDEMFKSKNKGFVLAITASLFLLIFSLTWNQYAIVALGIGCMFMTIADVIQINGIQREINEEGRATVMSIYSIVQNSAMIVFSLTYALLSDIYSLKVVYILISIYCLIGSVLIFFIYKWLRISL